MCVYLTTETNIDKPSTNIYIVLSSLPNTCTLYAIIDNLLRQVFPRHDWNVLCANISNKKL